METTTNYIVILWLLPATIFIVIPLLLGFVWFTIHAVKELQKGKIPLVTDYLNSYYTKERGLQKRREERSCPDSQIEVELSNASANIKGVLANISAKGFCVEKLTDCSNSMREDFSLKLGGVHNEGSIKAVPRWLVQNNENNSVGFHVPEITPGWENYRMMCLKSGVPDY